MAPGGGAEPKAQSSVAIPTGTVTFLFSDIEGSTKRWESHRQAMAAAVARHESLMRAAMARHDGYKLSEAEVAKLMAEGAEWSEDRAVEEASQL